MGGWGRAEKLNHGEQAAALFAFASDSAVSARGGGEGGAPEALAESPQHNANDVVTSIWAPDLVKTPPPTPTTNPLRLIKVLTNDSASECHIPRKADNGL